MPPVHKEAVLYARRNTFMIKWLIGIVIAALGIVIVAAGGLYYLRQDTNTSIKSSEEINAQLKAQNQEEIIARVNELSGNIKLVVDVLSNEVLFSKLLAQIGSVMPSGTVLQNLTLDSALAGGLDLQIGSTSYESGVLAQVNLADPQNGIFSKADITGVSCAGENPTYPCTVTMRVLFSTDKGSFLKLNQSQETN